MLEHLAHELMAHELRVIRFNFSSVRQRLRGSPWAAWPEDTTQGQILEFRQQVLRHRRHERAQGEYLPLFLGGYSRGGLIATLAADLTSVAGSFALGFPFRPPGNTTEWRSAHHGVIDQGRSSDQWRSGSLRKAPIHDQHCLG